MEEYPIAVIPDTPTWSENFAFAGFDPKAGIEFFCHIGRWRRDVTLWREVVTVALPDGTVLVHRAIGNALVTPTGPGGSNFSVQVLDPQKGLFRLCFNGGVRRVPEAELYEGPLLDGPHFHLSFDLSYDAVAPLWDISKVGDKSEFMGAGHVEQFGRLSGTIALEKERYEINTLANRDHSRGPRVFDSNIRHNWLQGFLEDGLMFQFYEAEITGKVGPAYSEANVVVDGVAYAAKATIHDKLPFTENRHLSKTPARFTLEYNGKTLDITATDFVRTISIQSTSPNDMYVGRRQIDDVQNTTVLEQGVLYKTADGRSGFGHYERLVPGKLLVDPA